MRPPEVTYEEIIQAGLELQAANRDITGSALRRVLGNKGNTVRLKQVWDEYVSGQATSVVEPAAVLPVEVAQKVEEATRFMAERLAALASEMNHIAVKTAEGRAAEIRRIAHELSTAATRELEDAAQTLDDLENQLDQARAGTEELEARLSETQAGAHEQAVELAQIRERLALTEKAAKKASDEHIAELARLNSSIKSERARLSVERDEASKAAQTAAGEHDQARAELAATKAKAEAVDQTYHEHRKQSATEAHRAAERLTKAQSERDEARRDAANAREEAAQFRGQIVAMQSQIGDLMNTLAQRAA